VCGRKREREDRRRRRSIEVTSYAHAHSTHKRSLLKNRVRRHAIFPEGHFAVRGEEREENGTGAAEPGNRDMTTLCSDSGSSKRCTLDGGNRYIDRYLDRLRRERERESRQGKGIERKWEEKRRVFFSVAAMPAAQGRAELGSSPDPPDHADDDGKILQTNVFSRLVSSRLVSCVHYYYYYYYYHCRCCVFASSFFFCRNKYTSKQQQYAWLGLACFLGREVACLQQLQLRHVSLIFDL
jgi:hypothetical protein